MSFTGPIFNSENRGGVTNNVAGNFYISEDKADKIYKWLDAPDSSGNFLAAREKHHEKTGAWFIEGDEYVKWKETPDSALWVYGTPGCGKTVICSTVIEETLLRCSGNKTHACAYFFFDNRDAQTDQALHDKMIRSIIQQICDQSDGVPAPLVKLYGNGRQQVSVVSLQITLQKIIDGFERTYIIIDALDECINRGKVLAWIEKLLEWKAGKIRVLFSSRPEQDITEALRRMAYIARVTLNSGLAEKDIETYLDAMLSKMIKCDAQTIARIREVLVTRADGMFRWVALQIEELSKCRTRRAVEDQLQTLPKDLDGMYERALLKCTNQMELKQFLIWLAFSIRPLELKELSEAVTVDLSSSGLPSYHPELQYFSPSDMLDTCSSFVAQLEGLGTVKLAHMSVKDYLVSEHLKNGPASYFSINAMLSHSLITKTCLAYVFHLRVLHPITDLVLKSFPLCAYAAEHWIGHMRLGGGENEHLLQIMHCIFSLEDSALATWVRLDDPDLNYHPLRYTSFNKLREEIAAPLYYACISGLQRTARQLMIGGAATNVQEGRYGHALQAASSRGHGAVVLLLLEHGENVNAQGGEYGTALQAASSRGNDPIVGLLLKHGAEVNAQGGDWGTALQAASWRGDDAIVRLLLEHGADVNVQGGRYGNTLRAASICGFDDIVRLLLEHGADVNAQRLGYGTALDAASLEGHIAVVRLLLEHGADVNAQGGEYGTALQTASLRGNNPIIRLLLEHGADVNAQGGDWGNALQIATYHGYDSIVRLLLERGADVNAQGGPYGNALQAASWRGSDSIVGLLLEHGADVNAQGGEYGNALQAALERRRYAVVRLLLEHGADVNAQGGDYGTALQVALLRGNNLIIQLLLEHGADVNVRGGEYGTALQAASWRGHDAIVRLLLEHGADLNAQGGPYGNALHAALSRGYDAVVRLLLEHGAEKVDESHGSEAEDSEEQEDEVDSSADVETRER